MAINYPNFLNAPSAESPWKNALESVLKGYQMEREPTKIAQQEREKELANQLKNLELEHKPTEYNLNDKQKELANSMQAKALEHYDEKYGQEKRLREANIKKAERPEALRGALASAYELKKNLNPDSPDYEKDNARIDKYIDRLGQGKAAQSIAGIGSGIKVDLPEGKSGYLAGGEGLKKGDQWVTDDSGKPIGINTLMTPKMIDQWKAKEKFDVIYPFMNKSLSYYSGQNSWEHFARDVNRYDRDPEAKERIDNYLAAKKLLSIGKTSENARIGGHATNVQLKDLQTTLDSSEVYKKLESGKGLRLPKGYAENSGNIFKSYLDKVESAAKTNVPAFEYRPLNPEQNKTDASSKTSTPEIVGTVNGITTIKNGNKTVKIPEALVDEYMLDHAPPEFGGQYGK